MPTMLDYYRILGVSPRTELAEIKRRYRLLALKYHPDRNPRNPQAAARFRQVAEAYAAICSRRQQSPSPPPHSRPTEAEERRYRAFARQNLADFFDGEGAGGEVHGYTGPDFRYDLQIPFLTAVRGTEQEIVCQVLVSCRHCQGTGMQPGTGYQDCPTCQGRGRMTKTPGQLRLGVVCEDCQGHGKVMCAPCLFCQGLGHRLESRKYRVNIPSGIEDGTRILILGEGGEGFSSGHNGHLVIVVHVEPHGFYTRHRNDLYATVAVSMAQAVLGDIIEIPTPWGPRSMELPRGSRSGQSFLFPGLGIPANGNGRAGDLIITITVRDDAAGRVANHQPGSGSETQVNESP